MSYRSLPTVDEIRAAYAALAPLGVEPSRDVVVIAGGQVRGCCACGAVYLAAHLGCVAAPPSLLCAYQDVDDWSDARFGKRQRQSFAAGFHHRGPTRRNGRPFLAGRAVAAAIFGEA